MGMDAASLTVMCIGRPGARTILHLVNRTSWFRETTKPVSVTNGRANVEIASIMDHEIVVVGERA